MRLITMFGGMVEFGLSLLCVFWTMGISPSDLFAIAVGAYSIESLTCAFLLCCIPGVPFSIILTLVGLKVHQAIPMLDDWVDDCYMETGVMNRIFLQADSFFEAPGKLPVELKRLVRSDWSNPKRLYDRLMAVIQGVIAFAFIAFVIIGSILILVATH